MECELANFRNNSSSVPTQTICQPSTAKQKHQLNERRKNLPGIPGEKQIRRINPGGGITNYKLGRDILYNTEMDSKKKNTED